MKRFVTLNLANARTSPALMIKHTLPDKAGPRVLPAYVKNNHDPLLLCEARTLTAIARAATEPAAIGVFGWKGAAS
jgi:hypothetical protein